MLVDYVCAQSCSLYILLCIIDYMPTLCACADFLCAQQSLLSFQFPCLQSAVSFQILNSKILISDLSLPPSCFRVSVLVLPIGCRLQYSLSLFSLSSVPSHYVSSAARDYLSIIFSRWLVSRPDKRRHRPEWQLKLRIQDVMCVCGEILFVFNRPELQYLPTRILLSPTLRRQFLLPPP